MAKPCFAWMVRPCSVCAEKGSEGGACPRCGTWITLQPHVLKGKEYFLVELAEKGAPVKEILRKLAKIGVKGKDRAILSHPSRDFKLPVPSNISAIAVARGKIHLLSKAKLGAWLFDS